MKLDDWLKREKLTSARFAVLSGIANKQAVHKYRHGERFPTPEALRLIHDATKGEVTANDFLDQHAPPAAPPRKRRTRRAAPDSTPPSSGPLEAAE
jgi:transcriptional regulator with XRE-family HTH domain